MKEMTAPPLGRHGRVLVSFIDDDGNPVWSHLLPLRDAEVSYSYDSYPVMVLSLLMYSLELGKR